LGLLFAIGAMLTSALSSVLTKTISKNFDKRIISSCIGFSILVITVATVNLDSFITTHFESKEFLDTIANMTEVFGNSSAMVTGLTPNTNLTCYFRAAIERGSEEEMTANVTSALMKGCMVPQPPYFPADGTTWFYALIVALLGTFQQFCLIGKGSGSVSRLKNIFGF
jgi:drug/metabolite transporter (DMT)-like permease